MHIHTEASVFVPRPPGASFDVAFDEATLPHVLKAAAPIPGVVRAEIDGGGPMRPGARRRATMTDGSVMVEEILSHERAREHRYRWSSKPSAPLPLLIKNAEAAWTFEPVGEGTRIRWRYTFELTSPLVYGPALLISALFRRWMNRGLSRLKTLITAEAKR